MHPALADQPAGVFHLPADAIATPRPVNPGIAAAVRPSPAPAPAVSTGSAAQVGIAHPAINPPAWLGPLADVFKPR